MAILKDVSDTALWVAHYRAQESLRPDRAYSDPFAGILAGERGREIAQQMPGASVTGWMMVMRTTLIDRFVLEAIASGVDTIINIGAGLDTRPYRMDLPPTLQWIEADFPHMIAYKKEKLSGHKPKCKLLQVPVDLSQDEERRKFLREACANSKKTAVITEGVIIYLSNEQAANLAKDLYAEPSVQLWIQDCYAIKSLDFMRSHRKGIMQNAPILFQPDSWFSFFEGLHWKAKEVVSLEEESKRIGRASGMPLIFRIAARFSSKAREILHNASACAVFVRD
jgi:methyltransferase (TIGR00027 family)